MNKKSIIALATISAILLSSTSAFAASTTTKAKSLDVYPDSIYCSEIVSIAKNNISSDWLKKKYINSVFGVFTKSNWGSWLVIPLYDKYSIYWNEDRWNGKAFLDDKFSDIQKNIDTCKANSSKIENTKFKKALTLVQSTVNSEKIKMNKSFTDFKSKRVGILKSFSAIKMKSGTDEAAIKTWKKYSKSGSGIYDKSWNLFLSVLIQSQDERG